ncbi:MULTISPECIES: hypothetical protein [Vibrio]|uniref:hypothetical protein n=1 Tax=Vibrio TaxID=662 RepID=UPI0020752891|nr:MULTISPECIES: hypothetical protein [Vibrio]USD35621.1 hypothetical protein J8Z27_22700 [Vibrio sp. SCSIO 43186]USD72745.1 hypothetical protein J4N41_22705 [Vibrio sp. SCSIO 43139]
MFNDGQALEAFEAALDWADTVREASEYSIYRFEDKSSVRVYITDEHEIAVIEE